MSISYLGQYSDNKKILSQLNGVEGDLLAVGAKTDAIAIQIPNLAKGSDVAMLIGGIRSDVANVGDQAANAVREAAAANAGAVNAGVQGANAGVQGANAARQAAAANAGAVNAGVQGANAGVQGANAARQAAAANAGVQAHSTRFNSLDAALISSNAKLDTLVTQSNGTAGAAIAYFDASIATATYTVNNPAADLIGFLGLAENSTFINPTGTKIAISPISSSSAVNGFTGRINTPDTFTQQGLIIDFGFNKSTRSIKLNGLGWQSAATGNSSLASYGWLTALTIAGSNNGSTYFTLFTWNSIGFNSYETWKYCSFSSTASYRYIRLSIISSTSGNGLANLAQLRFYGSLNNP